MLELLPLEIREEQRLRDVDVGNYGFDALWMRLGAPEGRQSNQALDYLREVVGRYPKM